MEFYGRQGCTDEDQCFIFQNRGTCDASAPLEMNGLFSSSWGIDQYFDGSNYPETNVFLSPDDYFGAFSEVYGMFGDHVLVPRVSGSSLSMPWKIDDSSSSLNEGSPQQFPLMEDQFPWCFLEEEVGFDSLMMSGLRELEPAKESLEEVPVFNGGAGPGLCIRRKGRPRRPGGQPSKNLMAERRRRKRLNDRLSMLRSIVPKISRMDRTSIVGDTIDYMRELLHKIDCLQHQLKWGPNQFNLMDILKDLKPNEMLVRNAPKFKVEKRNTDTKIEVCCGMKPEMLLSTVKRLDSLGLEINHCVISCFSDFAMQASCSHQQGVDQMELINPDEVKQSLFRNAGYGGRCL